MKYWTSLWIWMGWAGLALAEGSPGNQTPPNAVDAAKTMTDIHDIKAALDPGADLVWLYWLLAALALAALVVLGLWIRKRSKKGPRAAVEPAPVAPEAEAYGLLDALAADGGIDGKGFYFRLSAIVRRYVERRFEFPAAEMTTEELLPRLDRLPLAGDLARSLKSFCRLTDPIKFAGAAVNPGRMGQDLAFAREFVQRTTQAAQAELSNGVKNQDKGPVEPQDPKQLPPTLEC